MALISDKQKLKYMRWRRIHWPRRVKRIKILSRHPFAVPFFALWGMLVIISTVFLLARQTNRLPVVHNARIVIVSHDGTKQIVPTTEATVGSLLNKLKITINEGDVVEPILTTQIQQDDFRVNIYRALPVTINIDGHSTFALSAGTTPRAVANQTGYKVYAEDDVQSLPQQNFLANGNIGQEVVINRSTPVYLNLYGTQAAIRTRAPTVALLLKSKHIILGPHDQVVPSENTALTPNAQVFIIRKGIKIESVTETIPMPIQTINDPNLAYGTNAVRQQGSAGQRIVTYQYTLENGVVVGRTVIQTVVLQQAVTHIVVIGASLSGIKGDMALAGISPNDYPYVDYIISHESGWCPTKAQGQIGYCPPYSGSVPSYGGYGLCQSTPGSKMATAGADWATNPITQLKWCSNYAAGRYGGWHNAYNHWLVYHNW